MGNSQLLFPGLVQIDTTVQFLKLDNRATGASLNPLPFTGLRTLEKDDLKTKHMEAVSMQPTSNASGQAAAFCPYAN